MASQGKDLSEAELQGITAKHDLDHNGVFDEVLTLCVKLSCDF